MDGKKLGCIFSYCVQNQKALAELFMKRERFAELDSYLNLEMQRTWRKQKKKEEKKSKEQKHNHHHQQHQQQLKKKKKAFWNMFAYSFALEEPSRGRQIFQWSCQSSSNGWQVLLVTSRQVTNCQTTLEGFWEGFDDTVA